MKITKDNYNELKSKDLENNYAKVWHVNEIREELLANTPTSGGVTDLTADETLTGSIAFQTNKSNITAVANTDDNSITFNYTAPYQEVIFTVESDDESIRPIYSSVEGLEYTNILSSDITILTPNLGFTCDAISVQLTVTKELGTSSYIEVPYVANTNPATGEVRVSVDHSSAGTDFDGKGIKSGLYVNIKFFNFALAQP
jgi:hypothetical protein